MELTNQEKKIQEEAIREIKARKVELIEKFIISKRPLRLGVISFFMAGSPGAGKTETSKRLIEDIATQGGTPLRVDTDDYRA